MHVGQTPEMDLVRIDEINAETNRFGTPLGMIQSAAYQARSRLFHPFSSDQSFGAGEVATLPGSVHADTVKMRFHGIES